MKNEWLSPELLKNTAVRGKALDKVKGCLIGGAVGDALGYPIEFMSYEKILSRYGDNGISEYLLDPSSGKAVVSDDTQMTLFTANGLLVGQTRAMTRGIAGKPRSYVYLAYLDWLRTQRGSHTEAGNISWLIDVPQLWNCRAPGATCLDALSAGEQGSVEHRINHSKGCGGVMRVAPVGLFFRDMEDDPTDMEGAEVAALTHSHSLGFMPAAFMTHIIKHAVDPDNKMSLRDIVLDARKTIARLFSERKHLGVFLDLVDKAIELSSSSEPDEENISYIGDGWCGDEALCIAIYCSLKYQNNFSKAIIAAVNHGGDSDSTGALTGNILGAWLGYDAIDEKWKNDLELTDVILELAEDLCYGCPIQPDNELTDPKWLKKYG